MRANAVPLTVVSLLLTGLVGPSLAQTTQPAPAQSPCAQIKEACRQAGFVSHGVAPMGVELMADCIRPIMQGTAQQKQATKALPPIDPQVVAACKEEEPDSNVSRHVAKIPRALPQEFSVEDRTCITAAAAKLPPVAALKIEQSRVEQPPPQGRRNSDLYHVTVEIDVDVAGQTSTYVYNCILDGQFTVIQPLGMR
jgi:hypothetical protein